jgi:dTDP-glucose 4,6-dehydratase
MPTLLVTGGAGFVGSNFVRHMVSLGHRVVNLDKLTYAGSVENLAALQGNAAHEFVQGDIGDRALVRRLLEDHRPTWVANFAAETHVDRSIDRPADFLRTNVIGAFDLLQTVLAHWRTLDPDAARALRFLQVSTDEVFGSLGPTGTFTEATAYAPRSPYAASKASADHFVRALHATYGLPTLVTHCTNNYGPHQFPEKLVPLTILNAVEGRRLTVYGDGGNVRDWIYVEDHCRALAEVLSRAEPGSTFVVGSRSERRNIDLVLGICALLDERFPVPSNPAVAASIASYADLVTFVDDRPGHDRRYAVDPAAIEGALGWTAEHTLDQGMRKTVAWYLEHRDWCERVASAAHRRRLGLAGG